MMVSRENLLDALVKKMYFLMILCPSPNASLTAFAANASWWCQTSSGNECDLIHS